MLCLVANDRVVLLVVFLELIETLLIFYLLGVAKEHLNYSLVNVQIVSDVKRYVFLQSDLLLIMACLSLKVVEHLFEGSSIDTIRNSESSRLKLLLSNCIKISLKDMLYKPVYICNSCKAQQKEPYKSKEYSVPKPIRGSLRPCSLRVLDDKSKLVTDNFHVTEWQDQSLVENKDY